MNDAARYSDKEAFFTVQLRQGNDEKLTTWKLSSYFKDYLAYIYTLFASVISLTTIVISGHQKFKKDKSMLRRLYGETTQPFSG